MKKSRSFIPLDSCFLPSLLEKCLKRTFQYPFNMASETRIENPIDHQTYENFCVEAHCGYLKFGTATYTNFKLTFSETIIIKKIAFCSWVSAIKEILKFIASDCLETPEEIISETLLFKILWKGSTVKEEKQYKVVTFYQKTNDEITNRIKLDTVQISFFISSLFNLFFKTYCYDFYINHCLSQILAKAEGLECSDSFDENFTFSKILPIIKTSLLEIKVEASSNLIFHVFTVLKREKKIILSLLWLKFYSEV